MAELGSFFLRIDRAVATRPVDRPPNKTPPPSKEPVSKARIHWSLLPILTVAGLFSGMYSEWFLWWRSFDVWPFNTYKLPFLASVSFGLSLAAVLWFYGLIRSWKTVMTLLALAIAVPFLAVFLGKYFIVLPIPEIFIILVGSFVTVLLQLAGFLYLLVPERGGRWVWWMALRSALAGFLFACVVGLLGGGRAGFSAGNLLLVEFGEAAWQTGLALLLGIALCAKQDSPHAPTVKAPETSAWPKSRFAVFPILVGYFAVVSVWSNLARERAHEEKRELRTRIAAEITQSLAEAPSLENLPQLKPQPMDQVLVMHQVASWTPYYSGSYDRPAEPAGISGYHPYAPYPHRLIYYVYYAEPENNYAVGVDVTQYPNPNWAKYEVRNTPGRNALIEDREGIKRLSRFGNNLYSAGPDFYWSSGDKLIVLNCSGILPTVIDEFLKAYLEKYPSSI